MMIARAIGSPTVIKPDEFIDRTHFGVAATPVA
jgi:hypothetical protein